MRFVIAVLILCAGIAVGVGSAVGARALLDDDSESEACVIAQDWANLYVEFIKDSEGDAFPNSNEDWLEATQLMNDLYDVAYKACHP